jgi:hypothetical protein
MMENLHAVQKAQYHAWFQHNGADGWITVARKTELGHFQQIHYKPEELADSLSSWMGEDVYFSQNTFYKPERSIENIRQLRSLYVDLDFYLFNYDPSWVMAKLEHEHFKESVPEPNLIIFSGQGLVLIWLLEPVPHKALPLWQAVQNYFLNSLESLGGDPKASDAARVFRLDGTINSKNGAQVHAQYRHDYRYELRQIQTDYLPELTPEIKPPKKKRAGRKKKVAQLFNTYKLHYARLRDLIKIVEMRDYEVENYRETICFLYRYWLCCYTNDPREALNQAQSLNLQFRTPLSFKEVERATRSAEKAWEARNNKEANEIAIKRGYPGAGYNISNQKLISWLDITPEEMQHLQTIIDANEKRKRKRVANMEIRRAQGVKPREEYLKEQQDKTEDILGKLIKVLKENPKISNVKLGKMLGVSEGYIRKLKKNI